MAERKIAILVEAVCEGDPEELAALLLEMPPPTMTFYGRKGEWCRTTRTLEVFEESPARKLDALAHADITTWRKTDNDDSD